MFVSSHQILDVKSPTKQSKQDKNKNLDCDKVYTRFLMFNTYFTVHIFTHQRAEFMFYILCFFVYGEKTHPQSHYVT